MYTEHNRLREIVCADLLQLNWQSYRGTNTILTSADVTSKPVLNGPILIKEEGTMRNGLFQRILPAVTLC